jgi:mannitol 2-dehydrogenase
MSRGLDADTFTRNAEGSSATNGEQSSEGALPLGESTLEAIAGRALVPTYERGTLKQAIVHIGVGGFHRAHQAVYLDDLAEQRITTEWGERGLGLLGHDKRMAEALLSQECLYTVVERDARVHRARVVGSMVDYLFAPENRERALAALVDPGTRIVTLTITEGGYNIDEATGSFDAGNPAIQEDLNHPASPSTVFGYLCEALDRRRTEGITPFTVLSCDNLQGNGAAARTALVSFARLRSERLGAWIEANAAFPNSMVDRITPQTSDADREMVAQDFGIQDAWPVVTEPFRQWIIEDLFCNGRPPLEEVGAQVVSDVRPYETMKLRLLNASHSAMGYLGYLAGYRYIHDVMGDPLFRELVARMMEDEVTTLLPPVPGVDLPDYKRTLLERFANPKIGDQVARICLDGSAKVPKFLLPSLTEALASGKPHRLLTLAIAGWFRYLQGSDDQGETIAIQDPRADELHALALEGRENPRPLLTVRNIFGALGDNEAFVAELGEALHRLDADGTKATLSAYLATPDA